MIGRDFRLRQKKIGGVLKVFLESPGTEVLSHKKDQVSFTTFIGNHLQQFQNYWKSGKKMEIVLKYPHKRFNLHFENSGCGAVR